MFSIKWTDERTENDCNTNSYLDVVKNMCRSSLTFSNCLDYITVIYYCYLLLFYCSHCSVDYITYYITYITYYITDYITDYIIWLNGQINWWYIYVEVLAHISGSFFDIKMLANKTLKYSYLIFPEYPTCQFDESRHLWEFPV